MQVLQSSLLIFTHQHKDRSLESRTNFANTTDSSKQHFTNHLQTHQRLHLIMADLTTLLGTDKFPPIFDALTSYLPIKDIITLTRTCRTLQPLYQKMINNGAWDINNRLKKFVKDPVGFRKRLAELDGIISGGFALQFLDRVDWEGSDLDVCVQVGEKADAFCRYIEEVEGYDLASRKVGKYAWTHVDMVSFAIVIVTGNVLNWS
jgi:hypothetical protein